MNILTNDTLPLLEPCTAVIQTSVSSFISGTFELFPSINSLFITAVWFAIVKLYLTWQFPLSTGFHFKIGMFSSYENESIVTANGKSELERYKIYDQNLKETTRD